MSIKITEDDRLMAEFTNDEVTRIEVTFEHGRQTWILEGDHWEVVPGWDIVDGKLVPATNCKACEDGGSNHADGCFR